MTDLARHEAAATCVEPTSPREFALAVLQAWDGYKQRVAQLDRFVRDQLLAWCETNGRLEVGDGTYYVAKVPTDRPCEDIPAAVEAILEASDVATLAACIASGGLKHGAASKVLPPEVFDRLFPRRTKPALTKGGKVLAKVDPQFIDR